MLSLTTKYRRELKALAHAINPIVTIGKIGLSASVMDELDRALLSHGLLKVKVQIDDREARKVLLEEICQQLDAAPVQQIGKILVVYRPKPEETEKLTASSFHKKKSEPRRTKRSFQS
ncbi:MAG: ribosome assembly RNA-binding protein YhbY [Nitrosomonas sp.]|nr:ribosome assembly RNA-binding protein YhbY [Nitrosomonas sp.]MDP1949930.1 ribosome assembly RNA-binding protein YhbY [Nitrosomonas sp.]